MGQFWSIPWIVWPQKKELFAKSCLRYFKEISVDTLVNTILIQSFFRHPDALEYLKSYFIKSGNVNLWHELCETLKNTDNPVTDTAKIKLINEILN
jgi:hypothetical protein